MDFLAYAFCIMGIASIMAPHFVSDTPEGRRQSRVGGAFMLIVGLLMLFGLSRY